MVEKKCEHCGKIFNAKGTQKFCSKECRFAKIKCAECGKEHKRHCKNPDGEYICDSCYYKYIPLIICAECGKEYKKKYKNSDGEYICDSCYNKYVPLVICVECGQEHKRSHKNPDGEYICASCYQKKYRPDVPLIICAECGKEHKRNYKNPDGEYICESCYHKYVPLIICAECGQEHKRHYKNSDGEYICESCYYKKYQLDVPLVVCSECGQEHKRHSKNPNGEYICDSCYHKKYRPDVPLVICTECGQEHKRHCKNSNGEYICDSCYNIYRCKKIIIENMQYYNFKNENDIDLFLSNMKKKYPHIRIYRQLECELLGYGNYNKAMNQAIKRDNYTCQITGKKGNVVVHHLNSYNTHKELGCDLDNLISLDQDFHNLYHDIYGRGNNTEEQFWEFVEEWKKGTVTLDDFKEEE